ncbi:MAG: ParB/RepB/Spo0J family partition protein, partial [Lachnospiraceae bacterium]|nr:ParB/RepB/Spo0J family partition protein [Lachnospiraceae bacterium]
MAKKTGLGRGLDSLISTSYKEETPKTKEISTKPAKKVDKPVENMEKTENGVVTLRISMIDPNKNQPRKAFKEESLKELADSITTYGIIQPIVVTRSGKRYQIVAGERRFRAAKLAGLKEIPVIIREFSDAE